MRAQRVPSIVISLAAVAVLAGWYLQSTSPGAIAARERAQREERALAAIAASEAGERGAAALAPIASSAISRLQIEVRAVERQAVAFEAELSALLGPARRVLLSAEVEGRVVEVSVEEHTRVEAGERIVQIERELLQAAATRARASVQRARANHDLAKLELKRQRGLQERNATSAADFDRARSSEQARAADLVEARARLDEAQLRLGKAEIRAPFAGIVSSLDLEPGAYLRVGEPVAVILDLSEIEIEVGVSDREVIAIRSGDTVSVEVDVFPGDSFRGRVKQVGRAADAQTRKYPVQIAVANPDARLLAGMLGRVRFDLGAREPSIRIPRAAAHKEFEIDYVFVVNGSEAAPVVQRRRVRTRAVPFRPDLLEVVEGLQPGERIATSRVGELRDGLPVSVVGSGP